MLLTLKTIVKAVLYLVRALESGNSIGSSVTQQGQHNLINKISVPNIIFQQWTSEQSSDIFVELGSNIFLDCTMKILKRCSVPFYSEAFLLRAIKPA